VNLASSVVEDNQLNRELLRDWLEVEGYESVCGGPEGHFEGFSKRLPDAVLLVSISVPKTVSTSSLGSPKTGLGQIPVIAVTAHA